MDKKYNPKHYEDLMYHLWQSKKAFNCDISIKNRKSNSKKKTFTILMPPPNANDPLHIGHAMFIAIEDIMIRYNRMLGKDTLWLPGTDHAGIETQFVFEKKLKKKKQSRFDFDRQTLYEMIWEYVQENSNTAVTQMKKMGASADWDTFRFMLDPSYVDEVLDTFISLHSKGLVYRDLKLVNYSPSAGTSYSELEINHIETTSPLYYIRYYLLNQKGKKSEEYIVIATTRPEPIFADTHLAVHPDNLKTKHLIGRKVANPITGAQMEIIADSFVDPEFGTGIVKLTPAHDHTDFEVAQRHNIPVIEAITTEGRISKNGGVLAGLKVKAAREKVVEILSKQNAIEKINTTYQNRLATDYKSGQPIEPLPLAQFFVKVKPLTEPILKALHNKTLTVHGSGHDKILRHWLENLRDWNISRQIVWGIRMPVWYSTQENPEIIVTFLTQHKKTITGKIGELISAGYDLKTIQKGLQTLQAPIEATYVVSKTQPGDEFIQETDTFDTWFSSAQWPFATLKSLDSNTTSDTTHASSYFNRYYPTQVMETGYDILPFWVMRMLLIGHFSTGKLPFKDVYLHGLVRDQSGKKMSKSKGNVINPLDIIDQYGADALRMALVIRSTPGLDKSVGIADFKAMRNVTNKMWNATRFIILLKSQEQTNVNQEEKNKPKANTLHSTKEIAKNKQEFEQKIQTVALETTNHLNNFRFGLAAETLYNEFWHWFCDECIEKTKEGSLPYSTLYEGLLVFLKLFHPFMPFITETLWQELNNTKKSTSSATNLKSDLLIAETWPYLQDEKPFS